MKKTLSVALVLLVVCTFGAAHAALQNNGGGLVYDSDLDITWYYICGAINIPVWADALAWAAGLNVGGVTGWRLPTTPGTTYWYTTEGELGHLFSALGGVPGSQLLNYSPFDCSVSLTFWTSTDYAPNPIQLAWAYNVEWGAQAPGQKNPWANQYIWGIAIHTGNITASDLTGTWHFQVFTDNTSTNVPTWGSGTMILDSTGAVTGGTVINDSGVTQTLTGGSLTIDSAGQVAGTVTLSGGAVEYLPHGRLDAGNTVLTMVNTEVITGLTNRGLFVAAKDRGTFTQADLAGTWYFQVFSDNKSTNAPYWAAGAMDLDSTGALTGGTVIIDPPGETKPLMGGSFGIDSAGQVAGTVTLSDGTESLPHGKLNAGKTVLAMVNTDQTNRGLFVALKGGGTFTQADLAGTWYIQAIADKPNPSVNNPYWFSGTMLLNTTGAVTGGTAVNSFGESKSFTGGSLTIDNLGRFSGSFLLSDGQTGSIPYGKLDSGKGILTMVVSDSSNRGLIIAAKGGPAGTCSGDFTADGDVDGSDLAALIANSGLLDIPTFAQNFGKNVCQ
jgi:hypothetical protein